MYFIPNIIILEYLTVNQIVTNFASENQAKTEICSGVNVRTYNVREYVSTFYVIIVTCIIFICHITLCYILCIVLHLTCYIIYKNVILQNIVRCLCNMIECNNMT